MSSNHGQLICPSLTLYQNFEGIASRNASRPALTFYGQVVSYGALLTSSQSVAAWLQERCGVRPGDRVAILMQNCPQWAISFLGILRADAVLVPLSPLLGPEELRHYFLDSRARMIICGQDTLEAAAEAGRGVVEHIVVTAYGDYLPSTPLYEELPGWLTSKSAVPHAHHSFQDAVTFDSKPKASVSTPDDICILPYTSGSTGRPKACVHTHRQFMHTGLGLGQLNGFQPGTVCLGMAPMFHVGGLGSLNAMLQAGASIIIMTRWSRTIAAQLIEKFRIEYASIFVTAINDLLADAELANYDLSSLRILSGGGMSMPASLSGAIKEKLGLEFVESYGMTETASAAIVNSPQDPRRESIGRPFYNTEARILDLASLKVLGPGETGEIAISGPQLFERYWGNEGAADDFVEIEGRSFFRTGDIGHVDDQGFYFVTDRLKRMINASGFKVWPAEVEKVLIRHPAVLEVCVVGAPDSYRGETVKALVVLKKESQGVTAAELTNWSKEHLAAHKYPRIFEIVDSLPKSPAGKILWRELQDSEFVRSRTDVRSGT
jgi:fatty-acyl-CoA synthase